MPSLRVHKNGEHLCTVGSEDVWMFSASVWADIFGPEASNFDVTGSAKRTSEEHSDFLIWECPHELAAGDRIEMFFEAPGKSLPRGTVFRHDAAESVEPPKFEWSNPPTEAEIRAVESRPAHNTKTKWSVALDTRSFELAPNPSRQHITLHLLWNDRHPERLRASLYRKSLREIVSRTDGEEFFLESLPIGSRLVIAIGA